MERRKITIEDLLSFKFISDPQISPDGKRVVLSVKSIDEKTNRYFTHLYMADLESQDTHQFTYGEVNDNQPRWSPTSDRIAFLRANEKDTQVWCIPANGGEANRLTSLNEGAFGKITWSPDGSRIAFEYRPTHPDWTKIAKEERAESGRSSPPRVISRLDFRREGEGFRDLRQHIWVINLSSGEEIQITEGEFDCLEPTWSPDSNSIGFIANQSEDPVSTPFKEDIWRVGLYGGEHHLIPTHDGYKWGLSWSPNGEFIAYNGSETRDDPWCTQNDRVWIVPTRGGPPRCLTHTLDRIAENVTLCDVRASGNQNPIWSSDGKVLYFIISDRGNAHLYKVALDGNYQPVITGEIDICGFGLDARNKRFAFIAAQPQHTAEIFIKDVMNSKTDSTSKQITRINSPILEKLDLSKPEEIYFTSIDQTQIQGWLLKPPDFDPLKKYPLILYIHGGPAAQYGNTFFHEFQVLAAKDYIVLFTNPRGSLGREAEYASCIQGDWGNLDFKDLMAAVDNAESLPYVDGDRMAVVGGSYGGFMTTWIIGNTNRFCCAISERGISNRHSAVGSNDFPPMPDGYWPGNPWDQPDTLWQQSPLRFASEIHTPLLIIHSEGDLRCPISQADQLFSALRKLKREVVFLRYPAETNHGLSRNGPPDLRIDRLNHIVGWLDQHLK